MLRLLRPLFALFAASDDAKLRQMIEYLKAENEILRSKLPTTLTLKICYEKGGTKRPAEFKAANAGEVLLVLKRK
jgi:hypothetical protein